MAYSRLWSSTNPTGNEAANTLATIITNYKVDVVERLTDILGISDFTADPLRPGTVASGVIFKGANNFVIALSNGAPISGVGQALSGIAGPGSIVINYAAPAANVGTIFTNVNTLASPTWAPVLLGDSI